MIKQILEDISLQAETIAAALRSFTCRKVKEIVGEEEGAAIVPRASLQLDLICHVASLDLW